MSAMQTDRGFDIFRGVFGALCLFAAVLMYGCAATCHKIGDDFNRTVLKQKP